MNAETEEEWVSDCCGADMGGVYSDILICPDCKDHCDAIDLNEDYYETTEERGEEK